MAPTSLQLPNKTNIQQFFLVLESDWLISVWYESDNRAPPTASQFVSCITPLAVFLTASVMADAQIHCNIILFLCQSFLGKNVLVVQICSLFIKIICINIFGDVSSSGSAVVQRSRTRREQTFFSQIFWNLGYNGAKGTLRNNVPFTAPKVYDCRKNICLYWTLMEQQILCENKSYKSFI